MENKKGSKIYVIEKEGRKDERKKRKKNSVKLFKITKFTFLDFYFEILEGIRKILLTRATNFCLTPNTF